MCVCLSACQCVCLFVYLFAFLSMPVHLSASLSVCLSVCLTSGGDSTHGCSQIGCHNSTRTHTRSRSHIFAWERKKGIQIHREEIISKCREERKREKEGRREGGRRRARERKGEGDRGRENKKGKIN